MKRISLNRNWEYVEAALQNPLLVNMLQGWKKTDLPHDYSIEKGRSPHSPAGLDEGFFDGAGLYYKKTFLLKEAAAGKQVWLEFEGISGMTEIWVNKKFVAKHLNPYTSICVDVTDAVRLGENEIMVHTDSRMKPNSRWYVGAGIYRSVWLHIGEKTAVKPYGLKVSTKKLTEKEAILDITVELSGETAPIHSVLRDADGNPAATAQGGQSLTMTVSNPHPWSTEDPYLYTMEVTVGEDVTVQRVGLRTVEVNPQDGFLLNGKPMKLKGGCIHHDLGVLGAADFEAAERRRIRILKESGFNAVRGAHNPFGPAFFETCDELGMLVIEEAFDEWVLGRTSFGPHMTFEDRWERDLEDMISRDYNHPCIVMWSTGNEVEERDGSADGFAWAKKLADKVRSLDANRPVSASACALFSEYGSHPADGTTGNQALNMAYDAFAEGNDLWGPGTEKYFAPLDVAGYNYKSVRYAYDQEKYPNRVIYGSESYPRAAWQTWNDTVKNPNVIGDFVWTAWDYLGEVGVGRWEVSQDDRPGNPAWPWMSAGCSDIDLIGQKRPQSYYRDTLWSNDRKPHIFCLPPELTGKNIARLSWGWLPVERNYSYAGFEGQPTEVHIYANAEEVALLQNGVQLGRKALGENRAVFTVSYVPGTLEAISYFGGAECGRDTLTTAGEAAAIRLQADRNPIAGDGNDLCFVTIQAVDAQGRDVYRENREITVSVQGAKLIALGNADPKPERTYPFTENRCPLYQGKALAVIRSERDARGCLMEVSMDGSETTKLGVGFALAPMEDETYVAESKEGPLDLPLGVLMENEKALAALGKFLPVLLNNPMLGAIKSMSLKKLLSMGAMPISPELTVALEEAYQ